MPLRSVRAIYLNNATVIFYTDCHFTFTGLANLFLNGLVSRLKDTTLIMLDCASSDFERKVDDALKLREVYGENSVVFILTSEEDSFEFLEGIHFISLRTSIDDLIGYVYSSIRFKNTTVKKISKVNMDIIYLQSCGVKGEMISVITNKSRSTIKNNLSYCKRKLNIKNHLTERALISTVKCIYINRHRFFGM